MKKCIVSMATVNVILEHGGVNILLKISKGQCIISHILLFQVPQVQSKLNWNPRGRRYPFAFALF